MKKSPAPQTPVPLRQLLADRWLAGILLLALVVRLLVWWLAPYGDWIGDEREYYSAAMILADGRGFTFFDQSIWLRPPLYIAGLAVLLRLFGQNLLLVWVTQLLLSLTTVALVYLLGRLWYPPRPVARIAALLTALYLPFAVYTHLLLSETVFTFLIVLAFVALASYARREGTLALVIAGGALGCAILTRGSALPFLAAIPLWALGLETPIDWRKVLQRSAIILGLALLCIAPWTLRNYLAYGRLIPVDTTGGYNFWLGALQGQNTGQINATLQAIPNHADRQTVAWAQGWAVIQAEPLRFLRKSAHELLDLWRINFASFERLTRGYGLGRVPIPWLALTAIVDDLLYLCSLPLAIIGWRNSGTRVDRRLLWLWLGWNCLAAALFFSIARFRLPLMPFILLLAAHGLYRLPNLIRVARQRQFRLPRRWLLVMGSAVLALAVVLPSFLPGQYLLGTTRRLANNRLDEGYTFLSQHQPAAAEAQFAALPADYPFRGTGLAAAYHAQGQDDRALAALSDDLDGIGATLLRGDIFRAQGQLAAAQQAFNYRDVRIANPTAEAWAHLNPAPLSHLDIGDGLDLGYLRGVNLDEREGGTTYRWTTNQADFRLANTKSAAATVQIRLRGYRPTGAIPPVRLTANGQILGTVTPTTDWQVYRFPLPPQAQTGDWLVIRVTTPTFVLSYADQRELGVMIDWIEVQ